MLDIKFIRENRELVKAAAKKKKISVDLDALLRIDGERLALLAKIEQLRAEQNKIGEEVPKATDHDHKIAVIAKLKQTKEALQKEEETMKEILRAWQLLMLQVPNIPDISVPDGDSDADNQEVRTWGEKPQFTFQPKSHLELIEQLNLADLERGAKVAGFRGYFLKNEGASLCLAIWQYVLNQMTKKGFTPFLAPALVRRQSFVGTGYLPQGEEDLYYTQDGDYLAGTAEVAMMSYLADEVIPAEQLPLKYVALSPCFRREAGSHGKDTKGLIRVHEFMKIEQLILCEANHETSVNWHEELTKNAEEILQGLGLPYRVVINCGADIGLGQVKKYDLEAWVPSENKYRETHSSSYFHDFQTRRLGIRYRDGEGKMHFAHSLNNTAIATPRLLVPLLENYQQADGRVVVPEVLRPYLGKDLITNDRT